MQHKLEGKQKSGIVPGCSLANDGELGWLSTLNPFHSIGCTLLLTPYWGWWVDVSYSFLLVNALPAFLKHRNPNHQALETPVKYFLQKEIKSNAVQHKVFEQDIWVLVISFNLFFMPIVLLLSFELLLLFLPTQILVGENKIKFLFPLPKKKFHLMGINQYLKCRIFAVFILRLFRILFSSYRYMADTSISEFFNYANTTFQSRHYLIWRSCVFSEEFWSWHKLNWKNLFHDTQNNQMNYYVSYF